MKVTILGAGCGIPSEKFSAPGILLEENGLPFVFDLGSGSLVRMLKAGVSYTDIKVVFLTHFHSDHAADVVPLIQALWTTPFFEKKDPLTILGPDNLEEFVKHLAGAFGDWVYNPKFPLELIPLDRSELSISSFKVRTLPMSHRNRRAIGYRIENEQGKVFAYSGDTDVCDEVIRLAEHADLCILECSFPEKRKMEGHLIPREAALVAAEAGCKHLVLTHFYPPYEELFDEIKRIVPKYYNGKLTIAHDLLRLIV